MQLVSSALSLPSILKIIGRRRSLPLLANFLAASRPQLRAAGLKRSKFETGHCDIQPRACLQSCIAQASADGGNMKCVEEGAGELVISRGDSAVDLQVTDYALDAVARYMRLSQRILALRLDLGGMQERMPASCRLARMIGDWYLRKIEKPNEVQAL
jgi:hypothetical protein